MGWSKQKLSLRHCALCPRRIMKNNKTGVCVLCQETRKTEYRQHRIFTTAVAAGQEEFVFPTKEDL